MGSGGIKPSSQVAGQVTDFFDHCAAATGAILKKPDEGAADYDAVHHFAQELYLCNGADAEAGAQWQVGQFTKWAKLVLQGGGQCCSWAGDARHAQTIQEASAKLDNMADTLGRRGGRRQQDE